MICEKHVMNLLKDELNRRTDRDLRTLYLRFKSSDTAPKSSQDIFALEKGFVLFSQKMQ